MVIEAGGTGAQESERDSRRPGPDTPKPLEDPKVGEVVSQDLATQEIKRVRRTESSPSPPAAAAAAAGVNGVPENGVTPAEQQQQQQPRPNGGGKAEGEEKSGLGETGKEGTSAGGSEPQTAGSKGDGQGQEDPPPKVGGSGGAAGESSGGDEGVRAEGESTKPNGVAVAGAASSSPSKAAGAMPPPLPKSSAVDLPSSSSSPFSSGAGESPSSTSDRKTAVHASSSQGARPGPEAGKEIKRQAAEGEDKGKGKGAEEGAGERRTTSPCPDHALPVARTFFDFESVSGLEMRMLPEFFTGRSASKTPEVSSRVGLTSVAQDRTERGRMGLPRECARVVVGTAVLRCCDVFFSVFCEGETREIGTCARRCVAPITRGGVDGSTGSFGCSMAWGLWDKVAACVF